MTDDWPHLPGEDEDEDEDEDEETEGLGLKNDRHPGIEIMMRCQIEAGNGLPTWVYADMEFGFQDPTACDGTFFHCQPLLCCKNPGMEGVKLEQFSYE